MPQSVYEPTPTPTILRSWAGRGWSGCVPSAGRRSHPHSHTLSLSRSLSTSEADQPTPVSSATRRSPRPQDCGFGQAAATSFPSPRAWEHPTPPTWYAVSTEQLPGLITPIARVLALGPNGPNHGTHLGRATRQFHARHQRFLAETMAKSASSIQRETKGNTTMGPTLRELGRDAHVALPSIHLSGTQRFWWSSNHQTSKDTDSHTVHKREWADAPAFLR